jgi:hypothetical protein
MAGRFQRRDTGPPPPLMNQNIRCAALRCGCALRVRALRVLRAQGDTHALR